MSKAKSVFIRFLKGVIAGAMGSMAMIAITAPSTWADIKSILSSLAFAAVSGGVSGLFLAIEKFVSWEE